MKQTRVPIHLYRLAVEVSRKRVLSPHAALEAVREHRIRHPESVQDLIDGQPRSLHYAADVIHYIASRVAERRTNRHRLRAIWANRPGQGAKLPPGTPRFRLSERRLVASSRLHRLIDEMARA